MKLAAAALLLLWPAAATQAVRNIKDLSADLESVAKTASVMIDGDVCQRIVTPRAIEYILRNPSKDKWAAADNYDVDDASFIATKKTLIRLAQLVDYPVDVNLWMPLKPDFSLIHIAIRNRHEMSQFWQWGTLFGPTPAPMRIVLQEGKRLTITSKPGFVSVLAPVRNSLGDIAGLVEVVARLEPDTRENVK
jgi:hypothetical protein